MIPQQQKRIWESIPGYPVWAIGKLITALLVLCNPLGNSKNILGILTACLPPSKSPSHTTTPCWRTPLSFHWEQTLMAVMWMTPFIYLNCPVLRIYCSSNLWRGLPLRLRSLHKGTQLPASNEGVPYTAQVHRFSSALLCVDSTSYGSHTAVCISTRDSSSTAPSLHFVADTFPFPK